jgi:hypothetical protein
MGRGGLIVSLPPSAPWAGEDLAAEALALARGVASFPSAPKGEASICRGSLPSLCVQKAPFPMATAPFARSEVEFCAR